MTQLFKNVCLSNIITQFRYVVKETPWKKTYLRRFGYKDPLFKRPDTLPRLPEGHKYINKAVAFLPEYKLANQWTEKRKYFGQNDYIDILGDGSIHPVKLLTNIPAWLRGFQGNEFQKILLQQVAKSHWRWSRPTKWKNLNKRIMFLYRYLNRKTRNY